MTVFECEDSSDGIFTGIYDAWDSRLGHANVRLQLQGMHTLELFTQYRQVVPDAGKAEKVARTIRRSVRYLNCRDVCGMKHIIIWALCVFLN